MTVKLAAAARIAEANATAGLLNNGKIKVYSGAEPDPDATATGTLLAVLSFPATAFASATDDGTNASCLAGAIASTTGLTDGVAGYYRCNKSDDATSVFQGSITGSGGGGDMEIGNTSIANGQVVAVTNFIYRKKQV